MSVVHLLELILLGRVVLAFLPPGRVGGHGPAEFATTLSTSLLLGLSLGIAWIQVWRWQHACLVALGDFWPWIIGLAAIGRLLTLPGTFVPGPARPGASTPPILLALRWLALLAVGVRLEVALRHGQEAATTAATVSGPLGVAALLAIAVLFDDGLERLGAGPAARTTARVLLAAAAWLVDPQLLTGPLLPPLLLLTGGATSIAIWRRCADRRATWIGALSFSALPAIAPSWIWASAVGLLLVVLSGPGARLSRLGLVVGTLALLAGPLLHARFVGGLWDEILRAYREQGWTPATMVDVLLCLTALLVLFVLALSFGRRPVPARSA